MRQPRKAQPDDWLPARKLYQRHQTMTVILRCPRSCAGLEGWPRVRACCHPSRLASLAPQDDAVSQWPPPLVLDAFRLARTTAAYPMASWFETRGIAAALTMT